MLRVLSSLVEPEVIKTASGAANDHEIGIIATRFSVMCMHEYYCLLHITTVVPAGYSSKWRWIRFV